MHWNSDSTLISNFKYIFEKKNENFKLHDQDNKFKCMYLITSNSFHEFFKK